MKPAARGEVAARSSTGLVEKTGKPDPHEDTLVAEPFLLALQAIVFGDVQKFFQQRRRIAGIIGTSQQIGIGKLFRRDQVLAPDIDDIQPHLAGAVLQQPFIDESSLRAARPAIGIDRYGIRIGAAHPEMNGRSGIKTGNRLGIGISRDTGGELAEIPTEGGDGVDFHTDDATILVKRHFGLCVVVPRLRIRHEGFRARRGPFHRPSDKP